MDHTWRTSWVLAGTVSCFTAQQPPGGLQEKPLHSHTFRGFSPHLPSDLLPLAKLNRNQGMLWPRGCNSRVQPPGAEYRVKMHREQYPQGH